MPNILTDAAWFPARLDPKRGVLEFVRTERDELVREAFLDARWDRSGRQHESVPVTELGRALSTPVARPRLNFIWHTSFCCSTVIARALDAAGKNLSLKEPDVLTTLADVKRAQRQTGGLAPDLPQIVFKLLARQMNPGEAILVKPSNVANFLLPEAAALTQGRALMLYSDCASFLVAVMDRGEERRGHVRRVFDKIVGDQMNGGNRWPVEKLFPMTDLQIAALSWHLQISELASEMTSTWRDRAASLDCDAFLTHPGKTLTAIDEFFELELGAEHITRVVEGALLETDAKGQRVAPFAARERRDQWSRLPERVRHEVAAVVAWSYEAFKTTASDPPLPRPLVPLEKKYQPS